MVLVDISQSQCPVSQCGTVNPFPAGFRLGDGVLAAGSRDGLLNGLGWSVSYDDSSFTGILKPKVFIDLGAPRVNEFEDDGNRSVRFHRTRLRDVVSGNAVGHPVTALVALRHPLKIRMAFEMMAVLKSKSFVEISPNALAARAVERMGEPFGHTALTIALCVERNSVLFAGLMLLS